MQASAHMTLRTLQLQSTDTALVCLNVAYIAGKMMLVRALETGMNIVIVTPGSLPFAQVPPEIIIRFAAMVPLQVQATLDSAALDSAALDSAALDSATLDSATLKDGDTHIGLLNQLKALLIGGAPVSYTLEQQIIQMIRAPVYITYGMTETVSHIALRQLNSGNTDYTALDGIQLAVDDRSCLTIQGTVTNHQKIVTNDIVELADDRHFRWIGRADHVINSGGYKVFPEKVENVLAGILHQQSIPYALMIGSLPDERLGNKVVLMLEGEALLAAQEQKLQSEIVRRLPRYEIPKAIFYVPAFIMTNTGKVKRKATISLINTNE